MLLSAYGGIGIGALVVTLVLMVVTAAMFATVLGTPVSHHHKYRFVVEIDDFTRAMFSKCSALEAEIAKIETWEGGALTAEKEPGRITFSDITLERGVTSDLSCYNWFKTTGDASKDAGQNAPNYERNVDIVQLDRDGTELRRWNVERAWPTKYSAGEWDNESDEAVVESVTLTFKMFKLSTD